MILPSSLEPDRLSNKLREHERALINFSSKKNEYRFSVVRSFASLCFVFMLKSESQRGCAPTVRLFYTGASFHRVRIPNHPGWFVKFSSFYFHGHFSFFTASEIQCEKVARQLLPTTPSHSVELEAFVQRGAMRTALPSSS